MTASTLISGVVTNLQFKDIGMGLGNFTCTVNGEQLRGSMGNTGVTITYTVNGVNRLGFPGDPILEEGGTGEFLVLQAKGGYMNVIATRSPKHRLIHIPCGVTGGGCTVKYHNVIWVTLLWAPIIYLSYQYEISSKFKIPFLMSLILPMVFFEAWNIWRHYHEAKDSTDLMRALGYENPKQVDLAAISKEKCQQHQEETGLNISLNEDTFRY